MSRWFAIAVTAQVLVTGSAPVHAAAPDVRLVLRNPAALVHPAWPVTTGVPYPKSALAEADVTGLALIDASGQPVPAQVRVTSTWEPGSGGVRWLLLDFTARLDGKPQQVYTLRPGTAPSPAANSPALVIHELGADGWRIDTGPLSFTVRKDRFDGIHDAALNPGAVPVATASDDAGPYVVDADGTVFRAGLGAPDEVTLEEAGPLRAAICAKGWFHAADGRRFGRYVVRTHAYAGQPFLRILYTFIVTDGPDRARFNDIGFTVPCDADRVRFGGDDAGERTLTADGPVYLLQYDSDKAVVRTGAEAAEWLETPPLKQSPGWAQASTASGHAVTLACRDFAPQFPKELAADRARGLTFHAWPAHGVAKPGRPIEDATIQYLWFCHEGKTLDFRAPDAFVNHQGGFSEYEARYLRSAAKANPTGLAKTHELLLWFHPAAEAPAVAPAVAAWLDNEPVAMPDPAWMCASSAFWRLHPRDPDRFPDIERALDRSWDAERRLEAHTRDYGMFNWGDSHTCWNYNTNRWNDVYRTWRAFHHNSPMVSWLLYARSGEPKYLRHAIRNARHCMDIDMCHHTTPELEKKAYPEQKIVGGLNDYKGVVHWHSGSRVLDYNALTDFMLWYYYLTGDRRGLEVAQQWGTAAKNLFKKPFGHREGAGVTTSLIDLYRATWDPECKRIIDAEVNHFLDREQAMDGTRLCPSDIAGQVSHLTGKPMPRGAFAQWENYAPWLERYYELTGDTRAGERLVAWADAYIAGWGDSWSTFKPNAYINIMAYAYRVSRDPKYLQQGLQRTMEYVVSVQDSPGQLLDGFPHAGQISLGFCYMSARIPTLLAAIVEHGQPIEPAKVMPERQFTLPFTLDFSTGKKIRTFDVILREGQDNAFRILAEGGSTYKDKPVHVTITAPSGKKLIDQDILPKDGVLPLTFDIPADGETGDYRFQAAGEGSYWNIASTLRTDPALNRAFPFVGKLVNLNDCRYLFQVPTGVTAVQVTAEAGQYAMFAIRDPAGKLAARGTLCPGTDTGRVTVAVAVPAEHAGKLWTLDGDCGVASVTFTATGGAIPAVFAIHPDEFFVP